MNASAPEPLSLQDYLQRILTARVYDVARETPLDFAPQLSAKIGQNMWLKREDCQPVFSFKLRGAYNRMARLTGGQRARGVICASAGNHAQGVALSSQKLGCRALIVMPVTTPQVKIDAVQSFGGSQVQIVLSGESYSDAYQHALQLEREQGLTFIHPFDDPDVIAGQGTVAMEILRQHQGPLDAIFVAVGGGGLIAGVSAYVKALRPEVRIIAVQMADSNAMMQSVEQDQVVELADVGLFSDGTAVKKVGSETWRLARSLVDEFITVDTDEVCAAIKDIFQDTRSIVEPAGALCVAGARKYAQTRAQGQPGQNWVGITCGANMNFDRLRFVAERALLGEGREAMLAVTIPEARGSFRRLCQRIGGAAITEFNYRIADPKEAHIFIGLGVQHPGDAQTLQDDLRAEGFGVIDLSHDDLAKEHLRHMVGGRTAQAEGERLFRVIFPERPGALMRFLGGMPSDCNITLFHYRNQGADYARVLIGIQPAPGNEAALDDWLQTQQLPWTEESTNPSYKLFLR
ncbi:threonine ammonia-lyase, biosynthetic [Amphibiibacter pelophylacis]|uniref:Threonine ammonia-lyase, biosynthetic n=1 Tax=Amphibiibacter pelophylacis TaxID=1799477 RepID=A0ACC6P2Q5_9BURK